MNFYKKFIFLLQFVLSVQFLNSAKNKETPPKFLIRPNGLTCITDNKTVVVKYCYLKPYSRYLVTLNLGLTFLIPLQKPFYIQMIVFYRYGTIFRQVIDTKENEWCGYMEGKDVNPLTKVVADYINSTFPEIIHKCPYKGDFELLNYTCSNSLIPNALMFPQGVYRLEIIAQKNNATVVHVKIKVEITSIFKESFG